VRRNLFWLSDEQSKRIEPHLPTDVRGIERVDNRRVVGGIVHVLKSGRRWCDCPPEYGPPAERTEITSLLNLTNGGRIFFCFGSRIERRLAKISSSTVRTRRCFSQHAKLVGVDEVLRGPAIEIVFGHTLLSELL
jgi:transposase